MKIYTRTGDNGTTSIVGGTRLPKDHPQIEAYGTVDELNSWLGLLAASANCPPPHRRQLLNIQSRLFNIGAQLAGSPQQAISPDDITALERQIDQMDALLPPIDRFILPGGTTLAAQASIARTVCRRAERRMLPLHPHPLTLQFINRLSDWLFNFSRMANTKQSHPENFWEKDCVL